MYDDEKIVKDCETLYIQESETVVIRDENKKDIDFRVTREIRGMQEMVSKLNSLNESVEVRDGDGRLLTNLYCRIFNIETTRGGRYYRGDAVHIKDKPNRARLDMTIDGHNVAEIDITACNLVLCAILSGMSYNSIPVDPYRMLCANKNNEVERGIAKSAMMFCLNCESERSAAGAIQKYLNSIPKDSKINILNSGHKWVKRVMETFPKIAPMLCKSPSYGMKLQNLDSQIATAVLEVFVDKGLPILPVHDSFIVQRKNEDLLLNVLGDKFRDVMNADHWPLSVTWAYKEDGKVVEHSLIV